MAHSKWQISKNPKETQASGLLDKDIKTTVLNMFGKMKGEHRSKRN